MIDRFLFRTLIAVFGTAAIYFVAAVANMEMQQHDFTENETIVGGTIALFLVVLLIIEIATHVAREQ